MDPDLLFPGEAIPLYVYACRACGRQTERRQGFQDDPLNECPLCGGELRRVLQPVGIIFKGSGFYSTDNRNGSSLANPGGGALPWSDPADSETAETKRGAGESSKESGTESPAASGKTETASVSSAGEAPKQSSSSDGGTDSE